MADNIQMKSLEAKIGDIMREVKKQFELITEQLDRNNVQMYEAMEEKYKFLSADIEMKVQKQMNNHIQEVRQFKEMHMEDTAVLRDVVTKFIQGDRKKNTVMMETESSSSGRQHGTPEIENKEATKSQIRSDRNYGEGEELLQFQQEENSKAVDEISEFQMQTEAATDAVDF